MVQATARAMASLRDGDIVDISRETTRIAMAIAGGVSAIRGAVGAVPEDE